MRLLRPLGARVELEGVLAMGHSDGPKLLELLRTLVVGLEGVALETELERSFALSQSLQSHATDSRRSTISRSASDCCSASSLYKT